jgi:hypothetical protein
VEAPSARISTAVIRRTLLLNYTLKLRLKKNPPQILKIFNYLGLFYRFFIHLTCNWFQEYRCFSHMFWNCGH